jgi:hypothetical protein
MCDFKAYSLRTRGAIYFVWQTSGCDDSIKDDLNTIAI